MIAIQVKSDVQGRPQFSFERRRVDGTVALDYETQSVRDLLEHLGPQLDELADEVEQGKAAG